MDFLPVDADHHLESVYKFYKKFREGEDMHGKTCVRGLRIGFLYCVALLLSNFAVMPIFAVADADDHIVIGWNDLGMHCSNKNFNTLAVLPPYNNLLAQVIQKGTAGTNPSIVTNQFTLSYAIPGNTYSVGKTDFWSYVSILFGVSLPDNIGLTGNGLTGYLTLQGAGDYSEATGIPVTPYPDSDLNNEHPYQLAQITAYDSMSNPVAVTQPVIPVSNEMNCVSAGCHSSESQILSEHEEPRLTAPVLCANCHASNALGTPGIPEARSLSQRIHSEHSERTNDCYKCHPGPNTKCLRGVMATQFDMVCQDCHGSVANVANTIAQGRRPWLDEPDCGTCHGAAYAVNSGELYRNSKGHGGLYCSACHGSPHAILPSREANDNVQNINLQGFAGTLKDCTVCHGTTPSGAGPHGLPATDVRAGFLVAGDFNGDGIDDLAELTSDGGIYYTTNFTTWQNIPGQLHKLVAGDFNGDGRSDLAGTTDSGQIFYTTNLATWQNLPGALDQLTVGDLNGDGRDDLAGLTSDGMVFYTTDLSTWQNIAGRLDKLITGDFDGNGRDDLAGVSSGDLIFYSTDLLGWQNIPGMLDNLVAGDFSGNGRDGLAGVTQGGQIFYTIDLFGWQSIPGNLTKLAAGDFNADGRGDLAGINSSNQVFYTFNLAGWQQISGSLQQLMTGRFDASGRDELAGVSPDGQVLYTVNFQTWIQVPAAM